MRVETRGMVGLPDLLTALRSVLDDTAAADGVFCYTFFKAVATTAA